jgi:hypothetical protein
MCADFVAPQFQNPDFLGSYIRGQQSGMQAAAFPGQMQLQQQQIQGGQLSLQQLQMAMRFQQMKQDVLGQALSGNQSPQNGAGGSSAGIENGPQGSVSADSQPDYGFQPSNLSQGSRRAIGMLAPEMLKGMDEGDASALGAAQLRSQLQGSPLSVIQAFAGNPNAADALAQPQNAQWLARWPMLARKWGYDPKDMSNINVQLAATQEANQQRATLKLPPLPMPVGYKDVNGPYGEHGQVQIGGETPGKETEVTAQKPPSYEAQKGYNTKTGQNTVSMLQTSPGGLPSGFGGPQGPRQPSGGVGAVGSPTDVGYAPPSTENIKQVGFAEVMQNGLKGMRALESKGFQLSPSERAQLIDVAVNEDAGVLHNWTSQELLAHKQDPYFKQYMASMMPVIQAVSHDQSGARLNPTTIRSNLEGIIPVDVKDTDAMKTINGTRDSFQKAMNVGAGSAAFTPEFKDSVGAQRDAARNPKTVTVGGKTYIQRGERWFLQPK